MSVSMGEGENLGSDVVEAPRSVMESVKKVPSFSLGPPSTSAARSYSRILTDP